MREENIQKEIKELFAMSKEDEKIYLNFIERIIFTTKIKTDLEWQDMILEFIQMNDWATLEKDREIIIRNIEQWLFKVMEDRKPRFILNRK